MAWTEDRVEVLKKLWAEGHSASQIAKELGGVTRNAVIGKVHRLGLSGRATPSRPVKRPPRLARPKPRPQSDGSITLRKTASKADEKAVKTAEMAARTALAPQPLADGEPATILTLRSDMCKWPIGDPGDPDFAFCGRKATCGPYCAECAEIAFQPSKKREKRKANFDYVRKIAG
ncbi:MAG: GcrA family cell cycle regulator [Pseudomonadota bacterium]